MAATVHDMLRRLATVEPTEVPEGEPGVALPGEVAGGRKYVPVLTVYLDMRPQVTGDRPAVRSGDIILKARLREIEMTFWPRGVAYDAVRADGARIERFLGEQVSPSAQGVAIFASTQHNLFETLEVGTPFVNEVSARSEPSLFQLAQLADDRETAVVAVVDTNTARLFMTRRGFLRELRGLDDDPKRYHKFRGANAMNQAHYQRRIENRRIQFADEVAREIERLVDREGAVRVVLAGDEVAVPLLRKALSPRIAQLAQDHPLHVDFHAPRDTIREEIEPVLKEAEADQDRSVVERLVGAVQSGGLGVAGLDRTRAALEYGQVDTLVLSGEASFPEQTRSQLIEQATRTGATVEVVDRDAALQQLGGVGALLRYPIEEPPDVGVQAGTSVR
jgi:Bacterial archaeo-eukaryotic release factor family 10/eRF1 domain 3